MITVETDIQLSDYQAFTRFVVRRALVKEANWVRRFLLPFALGLSIAVLPWLVGWILGFTAHWPTLLVTLVSTWIGLVLYSRARSRELKPQPNGVTLGPRTVSVDEQAIRVASEHHQSLYALSCVQHVGLTPAHIFVMVDRLAAIIVPRRNFPSPAECERFLAALKPRDALHDPARNAA